MAESDGPKTGSVEMPLSSVYSKEAIETLLNEAFSIGNTNGMATHGG